ncbi:MAG: hypothetical protein Q4A78_09840 [Peptostreptococcaceae bacterium]|nr:hypothetical protein [Peptostreptococcaceae bacterium]
MDRMNIQQEQKEILRLKQKYNELLARYHKANEFFRTADPEKAEKFEAAYQEVILQMQDIFNELRVKHHIEASHHELLGGFKL